MLTSVLVSVLCACVSQDDSLPILSPSPTILASETPVWFPPTSTSSPMPIAEPSSTPDLIPGLGDLLLEDTFSEAAFWSTSQSASSSAMVANERISLSTSQIGTFVLSTRSEPLLDDIYAEIIASPSLCTGEDEYGFVLRAAPSGDQYRFGISCDSRAKVDRIFAGEASRSVGWVQNPVIPSGAPGKAKLSVWASGSEMRFFVDDVFLFEVNDTVLYRGTLGVYIWAHGDGALSIAFSDLRVWLLEE